MQYVITGVLSLIVGIILWAIKRERISLVYDIVESEIFPREKTSGKYLKSQWGQIFIVDKRARKLL